MMSDADLLQIGYRYALSLTKRKHEAEDLTHDAWLALYTKYGVLRNKYLLYRTIHNKFIDNYRKTKNYTFESIDTHYELTDTSEVHESDISTEEVRSALDTLRPEERQAIYLNYYEGYSASVIGRINSMPRSTVLSLLQRGKKKMGKALKTLILVKNRKIDVRRREHG